MLPSPVVVLALAILLLDAVVARGQQGGLDPSFGDGGRVVTDVMGAADVLHDLVVEPAGTIVAVGTAHRSGESDIAVVRYSPDGEVIDAVTIDLDPAAYQNDEAMRVAILPDGRLILAGVTAPSHGSQSLDVMLLRLERSLARDPSFGVDGVVITPYPGYGWVTGLALQPDGRILLSGAFGLMRYDADGALDGSFGAGGRAAPVFSSNEHVTGVALQGGRILAVGATFDTGWYELSLARFLSDGTPDMSFGPGGRVFLGSYSAVPYDILVQPDDRIVVAGAMLAGGLADFIVWRFEPDGQLDSSFGLGGRTFTDLGGHDAAFSVALQADGRIVAAGQTSEPGVIRSGNFAVARYTADGALDTEFADGGRAVTDFFGEWDLANVVAIHPGRGVLVGGVAGNPQNGTQDFALARYDRPSNQPPVISAPSVSPAALWPPNHKMIGVAISYDVSDDRDAAPSCRLSVSSSEAVDGRGDGRTAADWLPVDAHHVRLRAERSGNGQGRVYTITITCTDSAGLESQRRVQVPVAQPR